MAQTATTTRIPDDVSCTTCRITSATVLTIDNRGDGELSSSPSAVAVDGKGRYWVAETGQLARIFSANGAFLQWLGRKGRGPNEYTEPFAFTPLPGDSMLVLDGGTQQAIVVGPDLRAARVVHLPGHMNATVIRSWPSDVLMSGLVMSKSTPGPMLHLGSLKDADGSLRRSFGYGAVPAGRDVFTDQLQIIGASSTGRWLSADMLGYRFSYWSAAGARIATFERTPSWFAARSTYWIGNPTTPPPPRIFAIREAPDRLVWVYTLVPANSWRQGWPSSLLGQREIRSTDIAVEKMFTTVVEIIDPQAGRVVARRFLDAYIAALLPDGRIAVYSVDQDDTPHLSIVSLSLTR